MDLPGAGDDIPFAHSEFQPLNMAPEGPRGVMILPVNIRGDHAPEGDILGAGGDGGEEALGDHPRQEAGEDDGADGDDERDARVRELAIELSPLVRVNGVAPATVVQGSAMFPRDRVIGSLAKYAIPYTDDEATDSLVKKLAQFYADRTLTKAPITPADQAEAYFLLVSQRLSKTTGQIITVAGGQ